MSQQYIGKSLPELLKFIGDQQRRRSMFSCEGTITSVDQSTYMAKVMLQPYEIETGWLPIGSLAAGPGWGQFYLPIDGTEVVVDFIGGEANVGRIRGCFPNDTDAPPEGLRQGEFTLQHKSGSVFHFDNEGNVSLVCAKNLNALVNGNINASALGDMTAVVSGDATLETGGDLTAAIGGDATIAAGGNASLSATGPVQIASAAGIALNGPLSLTTPPGEAAVLAIAGDLLATVAGATSITSAGPVDITGSNVTLGPATTIDGHLFEGHTHNGVTAGTDISGYVTP